MTIEVQHTGQEESLCGTRELVTCDVELTQAMRGELDALAQSFKGIVMVLPHEFKANTVKLVTTGTNGERIAQRFVAKVNKHLSAKTDEELAALLHDTSDDKPWVVDSSTNAFVQSGEYEV